MDHCLLFGGQGHLARTKLIPNLERQRISYTIISRKRKANITELHGKENVVAYMSIPTSYLINHVEKYETDFENISPLFILEKPHGNSFDNFNDMCEYLDSRNYRYLFNDHYLFKKWATDINCLSNSFEKIHTIQVDIKETGCINERLNYFESSGILLDMYQSHVVMIFCRILEKMFPTETAIDIMNQLSKTKFLILDSGKYDGYLGTKDTYMTIAMTYKKITLLCNLKKNAHVQNKAIYLYTNTACQRIPLDDSEGYDTMFHHLRKNEHERFVTKEQVDLLWRHIEFNGADGAVN